eukprot:TRINITY_DN65554_c0_g1_i1.p1 TRINITY_DN65554_c0_g1~~TRINITY_DN65554_c0_g1_i1.p1  ORF type:complete len:794 (+),score=270.54 TRINITY_DN65554_c0_g1_i1:80-2383(+)
MAGALNYSKFDGLQVDPENVLKAYAPGGSACAQPRGDAPAAKPPPPDDQTDGELKGWIEHLNKLRKDPPEAAGESVRAFHQRVLPAQSGLFRGFDEYIAEAAKQLQLGPERAKDWKDKGAKAFKEKQYDTAVLFYTRALQQADPGEPTAVLLTNRATSLFNTGLAAQALLDADAAVSTWPQYRKGFYRRGCCLRKLGHPEAADADTAASDLPPDAAPLTPEEEERAAAVVRETRESEKRRSGRAGPATAVQVAAEVAFTRDGDFGRRMVAAKPIPPGTAIVTEPPHAAVLRTEHLLTHCEYCLQHTPNIYPARFFGAELQVPGSRGRGMYCSADCAAGAWREYGHAEGRHPLFSLCSVDMLLALRCLLKSAAAGFPQRELPPAAKRPEPWQPEHEWASAEHVSTLEALSAETHWGLKAGGAETACAALALHSGALAVVVEPRLRPLDPAAIPDTFTPVCEEALATAAEALRRLLRQVVTNAVHVPKTMRGPAGGDKAGAVDTVRQIRLAKSLFQVSPMMNHSCDPNAFLHFDGAPYHSGRGVTVRVTRAVAAGEEICVAYADRQNPLLPIHKNRIHAVSALRQALSDQYSFHCRCTACSRGLPGDEKLSEETQHKMLEASTYFKKGRFMMREGRYKDAIPALESSLTILLTRVFVGEHRATFVVARTHDALVECFATLGDWNSAREHCERALRVIEATNGEWEQDTAQQRLKLCGICARCGRLDQAEAELAKAEETLVRYYGPGAAELAEIVDARETIAASRPRPAA